MQPFAGWLATVTPETAPWEIHLSDCAITTEGFLIMMTALEDNDAFPSDKGRSHEPAPMYLRLECNYIDETIIKEKVDENVCTEFQRRARARARPSLRPPPSASFL